MCIILHKPAGKKIKEDVYRECFRVNDDGMGFAYVDPEKQQLVVDKGFMNFKEAYEAIQAKEELELLIHFRRVSRGEVSQDNCHPFLVESKLDEKNNPRFTFAIAHNGTLPFWSTPKHSDTACFIDNILGKILDRDPWFIDNYETMFLLKEFVGIKNKLVFFRYDNVEKKLTTAYINKDTAGTNVSDGTWFSNYSWVPLAKDYSHGGGMVGNGYHNSNQGRGTDGEAWPDHNGWRWSVSRQMFVNPTGAMVKELSYRKPMEDEYEVEGKKYKRTRWPHCPSDKSETKITQTELLKLNPTKTSSEAAADSDASTDPEDEWDKEFNLAQGLKTCATNHLSKREKKELRRCAVDWFTATFGSEVKKQTQIPEMITLLRHEFREIFPSHKLMSIKELDLSIINSGGLNPPAKKEGVVLDMRDGMGWHD